MRLRVLPAPENSALEEKRELAKRRAAARKRSRELVVEEEQTIQMNELCEAILKLFATKEKLTLTYVVAQTGVPKKTALEALRKLAERRGIFWRLKEEHKLFSINEPC